MGGPRRRRAAGLRRSARHAGAVPGRHGRATTGGPVLAAMPAARATPCRPSGPLRVRAGRRAPRRSAQPPDGHAAPTAVLCERLSHSRPETAHPIELEVAPSLALAAGGTRSRAGQSRSSRNSPAMRCGRPRRSEGPERTFAAVLIRRALGCQAAHVVRCRRQPRWTWPVRWYPAMQSCPSAPTFDDFRSAGAKRAGRAVDLQTQSRDAGSSRQARIEPYRGLAPALVTRRSGKRGRSMSALWSRFPRPHRRLGVAMESFA